MTEMDGDETTSQELFLVLLVNSQIPLNWEQLNGYNINIFFMSSQLSKQEKDAAAYYLQVNVV